MCVGAPDASVQCVLGYAGAVAAILVGSSTLGCSWRMGITLLAFFGASSRMTQFREELKNVDESHRTGGQRDWQQVCLPIYVLIVHYTSTRHRVLGKLLILQHGHTVWSPHTVEACHILLLPLLPALPDKYYDCTMESYRRSPIVMMPTP